MIKGKNIDPIFIFKSKNARKLGKKKREGRWVAKVKDNPTVKNNVLKDAFVIEIKVLRNFKIGCRTDPNCVQIKLH